MLTLLSKVDKEKDIEKWRAKFQELSGGDKILSTKALQEFQSIQQADAEASLNNLHNLEAHQNTIAEVRQTMDSIINNVWSPMNGRSNSQAPERASATEIASEALEAQERERRSSMLELGQSVSGSSPTKNKNSLKAKLLP